MIRKIRAFSGLRVVAILVELATCLGDSEKDI